MRLTGDQAEMIAELSDGTAVNVTKRVKGDQDIILHRLEDNLMVKINLFGIVIETIREADDE